MAIQLHAVLCLVAQRKGMDIYMADNLLLVNDNDQVIGYCDKMTVHRKGLLHRAFSVFIFNYDRQEILLQKRAITKYHSGGLWSNTCCSHPYQDETWNQAISRCVGTELGMIPSFSDVPLEAYKSVCDVTTERTQVLNAGSFKYYTDYGEMKEHEIDHVFVWFSDERSLLQTAPNPEEVSKLGWFSLARINNMLEETPAVFSSWFPDAYRHARHIIQTAFPNSLKK